MHTLRQAKWKKLKTIKASGVTAVEHALFFFCFGLPESNCPLVSVCTWSILGWKRVSLKLKAQVSWSFDVCAQARHSKKQKLTRGVTSSDADRSCKKDGWVKKCRAKLKLVAWCAWTAAEIKPSKQNRNCLDKSYTTQLPKGYECILWDFSCSTFSESC